MSDEKMCPFMSLRQTHYQDSYVGCLGDGCEIWEEMTASCSFKAQQRHTRSLSVSFTELGMALIDVLKKMREEEASE